MGQQMCRGLALMWSALTIIFLLVISVLILGDERFPLNLGTIKTVGRAGLWVTLLPGLVGLLAVLLVLKGARLGAWILGIYSLFWTAVLISGLPAIWTAQQSFCTRTICITTPWVGRLLALALAGSFLLVALWTRREVTRGHHKLSPT
jgi:hypothetical protein